MKKIGIVTHYFDSLNYGGNLQAYALCKYFAKIGIFAEQISFNFKQNEEKEKINIRNIKLMVKRRIVYLIYKKNIEWIKKIRTEAFLHFNKELIPHSQMVYTDKNIKDCANNYDVFITGSDQVWNLGCYRKSFFLDFVPETKTKVSYAASISMNALDDMQKNIFSNSLRSFDAISVREDRAKELLNDIIEQDVSLVLDPTFLLDYEDWDEVCEERIITERYVFAYILGMNDKTKELIQNFARLHEMKLVYIPYAAGYWVRREQFIGDIQLMDASPEKFLSLIKHAEYIFTDSFHAVVFSIIFQKQFFVFNRDAEGSMNSRITSLTNMFDMQERFCETKNQETLEYVESLQTIDYNKGFPKYEKCREYSYEFIRKNVLS